MYASESSDADQLLLGISKSPVCPPVKIAEPPRGKPKASDAEECVENLRVDFDPDSSRRINIVAGRCAHCWGSVAKEEEEHASPCDDVEAVDCDQEARNGQKPLPEAFQSNDERLLPWQFGRWYVAICVLKTIVSDLSLDVY